MHFHFYANGPLGLVFLLILAALYFVPTIVTLVRHTRTPGVPIVINIFLGWTFIGWVVALALAFGQKEAGA